MSPPALSEINTVDSSSSSVETSNQQTSEFNSFSSTGKAANAQNEAALVSQIIGALTPSITQSVTFALSGQSGQSQTVSSGSAGQQQSSFNSESPFSSDYSSSSLSGNSQQTVSTSPQEVDQSSLVQQVLAALQP